MAGKHGFGFRGSFAEADFFRVLCELLLRFPERVKHFYDSQLREVLALIARMDSPRVLEVGCGTGTESLWMALKGALVEGIDLQGSRLAVAEARKRIIQSGLDRDLRVSFQRSSILTYEATELYDVVWMEQAFHHLEPRDEVIERVRALLRPGGHVVISESNGRNLALQLQLLRARGLRTVKTYMDEDGVEHPYGDERVLSGAKISKLFRLEGFELESLRHYRIFPNHPIFDRLLWLEKQAPRNCSPLYSHYNFVARKLGSVPGTSRPMEG